ncbi:MAG: transposase, partial [Mangrovibacterium sp.]
MAKVSFKSNNQNQGELFPPHVVDLVPKKSPAFLINEVVDQLDISELISTYKGGGTSSYHPRMMLKIIFMGYLNNVFSCRKIASMVLVNVEYMWLSGMQQPDFRTINDFRSKRLKGSINKLFKQVVLMLNDMGYLSLKESYIDGTKLESKANRYTFVWRKSVERYKGSLERKILAILELIDEGIAQDYKDDNDEFKGFDSGELRERIKQIN